MSRVPVLKPREVIRALERAGFVVVRVSGSHQRLQHRDDPNRQTTVPFHASRDLPRDIIEQVGMTVDEFVEFL